MAKNKSPNKSPKGTSQPIKQKDESSDNESTHPHDISCNINCSCKCEENIQGVKAEFTKIIADLKLEFDGKVEILTKLLSSKDKVIADLGIKLGTLSKISDEVVQGLGFITKETSDLKDNIDATTGKVDTQAEEIAEVKEKARDLEDRSRRCNLVFYNVPEEDNEKCDMTIFKELGRVGIRLTTDSADETFDRAHRLGSKAKWDRNPNPSKRPRPIIVKCTYFRDKQLILTQAKQLKDSIMNVSEDYSKDTIEVHKQLITRAKDAMKQSPEIKSFKVLYRQISLRFEPTGKTPFQRVFRLDQMKGDWFST